jgi:hypothetical protein
MENVAHCWRLWAKSSPSDGIAKLQQSNLTKNNSSQFLLDFSASFCGQFPARLWRLHVRFHAKI